MMRNGHRIGVVIPALNEEKAVARVIAAIPSWVDITVVADNGSNDATVAEAKAAGATVVIEPERGYGAACQCGIRALGPVDVVVFLDADYSDDPSEMASIVDPILSGQADMIIGSRVRGNAEPYALLPQQRFGNWLACKLMHFIFQVQYSDLGPFRAIRRQSLDQLAMQDRAFGWTVEMQIKAAQYGLRSGEVPVSYRRRVGVSKISGTVRGTFLAGSAILGAIFHAALKSPVSVRR